MIRNCDGTPYRLSGNVEQFDPENPDINLLNSIDQEATLIGGTPVYYYELLIQTYNTLDMLYREDRGKLWSPIPRILRCIYEPVASQNYIDTYGIDSRVELKLEFNLAEVLSTLSHLPKWGSRLWLPMLRENYVIVQNNLDQFKLWTPYKLVVIAQQFQEDTTTGEGSTKPPAPKINNSRLFDKNLGSCS